MLTYADVWGTDARLGALRVCCCIRQLCRSHCACSSTWTCAPRCTALASSPTPAMACDATLAIPPAPPPPRTDIRAELGRLKEYKETIWNDSSDRTVHQWSATSTKHGGATVLKVSVWTNTVRNYIRQKAGEIGAYKALEIGELKWCREHIPRNGDDFTEE